MQHWRRHLGPVALACVVLLSSCGGDAGSGGITTTSESTTTSTSLPTQDIAQISGSVQPQYADYPFLLDVHADRVERYRYDSTGPNFTHMRVPVTVTYDAPTGQHGINLQSNEVPQVWLGYPAESDPTCEWAREGPSSSDHCWSRLSYSELNVLSVSSQEPMNIDASTFQTDGVPATGSDAEMMIALVVKDFDTLPKSSDESECAVLGHSTGTGHELDAQSAAAVSDWFCPTGAPVGEGAADGQIEFGTTYAEGLDDTRISSRQTFEVPQGATIVLTVENGAESQRSVHHSMEAGGAIYTAFRTRPGVERHLG